MIRIKRVYDPPEREDGVRVLVDRVWPRGLSKDEAGIDLWLKDIAPSTTLRKWFRHDPERWIEFRRRYFRELSFHLEKLQELATKAKRSRVTLLYAAKENRYNNAVALKTYLEKL